MTWHPTTNRIQTMHLTPEERYALGAWPHGWELFSVQGFWKDCKKPEWIADVVYRGKPPLVVTSQWFNRYNGGMSVPHWTRERADQYAKPNRIDVLRIDTCNGVSTAHLEGLK